MDVLEQLIERAKSVGVSADLIRDNDCVFGYEASMSQHFWLDGGGITLAPMKEQPPTPRTCGRLLLISRHGP